jgi:hypothetical protein
VLASDSQNSLEDRLNDSVPSSSEERLGGSSSFESYQGQDLLMGTAGTVTPLAESEPDSLVGSSAQTSLCHADSPSGATDNTRTPIVLKGKCDGMCVRILVDSGANCDFISERLCSVGRLRTGETGVLHVILAERNERPERSRGVTAAERRFKDRLRMTTR